MRQFQWLNTTANYSHDTDLIITRESTFTLRCNRVFNNTNIKIYLYVNKFQQWNLSILTYKKVMSDQL